MLQKIENPLAGQLVTIVDGDTAYHLVSDTDHLSIALKQAENNGLNDVIQIAQGTYTGDFDFQSQENFDLSIYGGFNNDFTVRSDNPSTTVFDSSSINIVTDIGFSYDTNNIVVNGLTFQNHNSSIFTGIGSGLAIVIENGEVTVSNNVFQNLTMDGKGGALGIMTSSNTDSNFHVYGNTFRNNDQVSIDVDTDVFGSGGGALLIYRGKTATVSNNTFSNNLAYGDGGALWIRDTQEITISSNTFNDNEANGAGGAIYAYANRGYVNLSSNIINNNAAYRSGAAHLISTDGSLVIDKNTIEYNEAIDDGGAITTQISSGNYSTDITNNIINNNQTNDNGGGLNLYGTTSHTFNIFNNLIANNKTTTNQIDNDGKGGGIYVYSHFAENVYLNIKNNTITNNVADGIGGGFYYNSGAQGAEINLTNNIIYANTQNLNTTNKALGTDVSIQADIEDYTLNADSNDLDLTKAGIAGLDRGDVHAITLNETNLDNVLPNFVDPLNNDFRLAESSALIDVGNTDGINLDTDLIGSSRVINNKIDLGAIEYVAPTIYNKIIVSSSDEITGSEVADEITCQDVSTFINSGSGDDIIIGSSLSDHLSGEAGNDSITSGKGSDFISGGIGNDLFYLTPDGFWSYSYAAFNVSNDFSIGTNVSITLNGFNKYSDLLDGDEDYDTVILSYGNDAFFIDDAVSEVNEKYRLNNELPNSDSTSRALNIEAFDAGNGDDIIDLTSTDFYFTEAVTIYGGDGDDTLWASNGDDHLYGESGNDNLNGGSGSDILSGGTGSDVFEFTRTSGLDTIMDFNIDEDDKIKLYFEHDDRASFEDLAFNNGLLEWSSVNKDSVFIDLSYSQDITDLSYLIPQIQFIEII